MSPWKDRRIPFETGQELSTRATAVGERGTYKPVLEAVVGEADTTFEVEVEVEASGEMLLVCSGFRLALHLGVH